MSGFVPRCVQRTGKECRDCVECLSTNRDGLTCSDCMLSRSCVPFGYTDSTDNRFCSFVPSRFVARSA